MKRLLAYAGTAILVASGWLATADTAQARTVFHSARVHGHTYGCNTWGGPFQAHVRAEFNTEVHYVDSNLSNDPTYSVTFGNVPPNGGYAWMVVTCGSPSMGGPYGKWVTITSAGDITANL